LRAATHGATAASASFSSPIGTPRLAIRVGAAASTIIRCNRVGGKTRHAARRPHVRSGSWLRENADKPRMSRIVFSIAFSRKRPPVQLFFTSTKSRQNFYAQVQLQSFHAARVRLGLRPGDLTTSALPPKTDIARQIRFIVLSPTTRRSILLIRSERSTSAALMAAVVCRNVLTFDPNDTIPPSTTAIDPMAAT
jgi:hypothetical protein